MNLSFSHHKVKCKIRFGKIIKIFQNKFFFYFFKKSSINEIEILYDKFMLDNPSGQLNREKFVEFYTSLRHESHDSLQKITQFIFNSFDLDQSGTISFNEFIIGYGLTSKNCVYFNFIFVVKGLKA